MKSTRTNRFLIGAAAAVGVLAGAAGISSAVTGGDGDVAPTLDRAEAEAAAVAEVPGTVVGFEADDEGGRGVWEVQVDGEDGQRHEVTVDDSGAVVARDRDDDRNGRDDDGFDDDAVDGTDDDHDPALAADAAVSQADAEAAAVAEAGGGTVHRIHIEREDGRVVWDVEVDTADGLRHDIQVDATDASIVEHDIDD